LLHLNGVPRLEWLGEACGIQVFILVGHVSHWFGRYVYSSWQHEWQDDATSTQQVRLNFPDMFDVASPEDRTPKI